MDEDLFLICKEGGCPWDFKNAPLYPYEDVYGRRWWRRMVRCSNCGSKKFRRYQPRVPLEPYGGWSYDRPPGWYDAGVKVYWGKATEERVSRGTLPLPTSTSG